MAGDTSRVDLNSTTEHVARVQCTIFFRLDLQPNYGELAYAEVKYSEVQIFFYIIEMFWPLLSQQKREFNSSIARATGRVSTRLTARLEANFHSCSPTQLCRRLRRIHASSF